MKIRHRSFYRTTVNYAGGASQGGLIEKTVVRGSGERKRLEVKGEMKGKPGPLGMQRRINKGGEAVIQSELWLAKKSASIGR